MSAARPSAVPLTTRTGPVVGQSGRPGLRRLRPRRASTQLRIRVVNFGLMLVPLMSRLAGGGADAVGGASSESEL